MLIVQVYKFAFATSSVCSPVGRAERFGVSNQSYGCIQESFWEVHVKERGGGVRNKYAKSCGKNKDTNEQVRLILHGSHKMKQKSFGQS